MGKVFICYRREDSADVTGRMRDRLVKRFGKENIFTDVDSIPLGVDFRTHLTDGVQRCEILLAVIGKYWLEAGTESGQRRLDDERDFIRVEIEAALQRDIPVIPVLVQGATMPSPENLPPTLKSLAFRNGTQVRHDPDFGRDVKRLITRMDGILQRRIEQHEQQKDKEQKDRFSDRVTRKFVSPLRGILIGVSLGTLLNLLLLPALLLLTSLRLSFFPENVVLVTFVFCIPEILCGIVFGSGFAAIGKGGRFTGAISGAILWSLFPLFSCVFSFDVQTTRFHLAAWLAKELSAGLITGYVVARDVESQQAKGVNLITRRKALTLFFLCLLLALIVAFLDGLVARNVVKSGAL